MTKKNKLDKKNYMEYETASGKRALRQIANLNLPIPPDPSVEAKNLRLPQNMHKLSPQRISAHLAVWTNVTASAKWHEALAETEVCGLKAEILEKKRIELRNYGRSDTRTLTAKEAEIMLMPEMRKLNRVLIYKENLARMLKALREGYEAKYNAVSRELSRRKIG